MTVLRITNGFDKLSDAELQVRSAAIKTAMSDNPAFATPTPSLDTLQEAIDAFDLALAKAINGSSYDKAVKNLKRAELIELLHSLGAYVLFTANGDALVAKSSGYSTAKDPSPAPEVTPATNQQLEDGANAGELRYSFDKVPGARSYVYQYAIDPLTDSSEWQSKAGTVRKVTFSSLESGKKYWCRVMAIGINGQNVYSEPVSRIAQ